MPYERILAAVAGTPWVIEPGRGEEMFAILRHRALGGAVNTTGIEAAREIVAERQRRKTRAKPANVALIPLYGVMTQRSDFFTEVSGMASTDVIGRQVDEAADDPNVEAIVLDVDSPGGSVYGVEQLALKIQAAIAKKKVIAVANSVAASGAYWVASNASELVVVPDGEVGSVGVYWPHTDVSRAMDEQGVKVTYIKAGKHKTDGNPYEPLNVDSVENLQKGVDDYYDLFVRAIARGRKVSLTKVRDGFGQGGMVRASEAVKEGMADRVGTLDDVLARYGLSTSDVSPSAQSDRFGIEVRKRRMKLS